MLTIISAVARHGAIGKDNDFPWHLRDDFRRFRKLTTGHALIMGRGNYDHLMQRIGKMLPDRVTIVVTRNPDFTAPGVLVAHSLEEAIKLAEAATEHDEVFVIGGAQVYASTMPLADKLDITEVNHEFDGDAYFPEIDPEVWREVSREHHAQDDRHNYSFDWVTYERK